MYITKLIKNSFHLLNLLTVWIFPLWTSMGPTKHLKLELLAKSGAAFLSKTLTQNQALSHGNSI